MSRTESVNLMQDAFESFEWPVAPKYEWQDWLDDKERVVRPPVKLLKLLKREAAWSVRRFDLGLDASPRSSEVARAYTKLEVERSKRAAVSGPILTRIDAGNSRSYQPMDRKHIGLFRVFAELNHRDTDAILDFASQYGDLGLIHSRQTVLRHDGSGNRIGWHRPNGESHLAWAIEICHMREALALVDKTSFDALRRLRWLSLRHLGHVRAELTFDKARRPQLSVTPITLISALWLQLALAVTSDKRFGECKFCRRVLEISTADTGFRSHREFCSDSCKTLDYRKRKRTANLLAKQGHSVVDISAKVGTAKATVRAWLTAAETRSKRSQGEA